MAPLSRRSTGSWARRGRSNSTVPWHERHFAMTRPPDDGEGLLRLGRGCRSGPAAASQLGETVLDDELQNLHHAFLQGSVISVVLRARDLRSHRGRIGREIPGAELAQAIVSPAPHRSVEANGAHMRLAD